MRVIGTAGHVDHGKSTLVAALTGIHPDRLKEEQEREMTIDLGFAWLTLPDGTQVGIVDVPGHRDFIENMLAGVGGIDAALFVVAADEGVMPQTREHLAILDILQIPAGVIALTKVDLVSDPEWLDMVELDVRLALQGSVLQDAPLIRVSARSGEGLSSLLGALQTALSAAPRRLDLGRPRLPVDRVFSMPGFGTVVTGTLLDGSFKVGDEVEILPGGLRGRIRGLQSHKKKVQTAAPGSRTAVNISGLDADQIRRGQVVSLPGAYAETRRVDAFFKMLPDASRPLPHSSEVKLFTGAAEVVARARVLGAEAVRPGEEAYLQLELRDPLAAARGDRYILRWPSPGETIGGGEILDSQPRQRSRRNQPDVISRLEALHQGGPADLFYQAAHAAGIAPVAEIARRARLEREPAARSISELIAAGRLIALENAPLELESETLVAADQTLEQIWTRARQELSAYHQQYPLRFGMPREELKSRLKLSGRIFPALLAHWRAAEKLKERAGLISLTGHEVTLTPAQRAAADQLLNRFAQSPYAPPSLKECEAEVGAELLSALVDSGELIQVSAEVVFRRQDFEEMLAGVREHFAEQPTLTVAQFRDRFGSSRRYALGFLEYLDAQGITRRDGDTRRLTA